MSRRQAFNPIDRLVRRLRTRSVRHLVPAGSRVLDVGCGLENWLVRTMTTTDRSAWAADSLGIDPDLEVEDDHGRRTTIDDIATTLPGAFDVATSFAVVEHLPPSTVTAHLVAIGATLRPGGRLVLTTPTRRAKPVLEFLAYRLHLISEFEIRDHRRYYDVDDLTTLLSAAGFEQIDHATFQFGLNQRVVARRPASDDQGRP
jgi:2-polyprenyl-3-methyl-5-hydroxy-6-metoxy-1,4-benzoquinol methylase